MEVMKPFKQTSNIGASHNMRAEQWAGGRMGWNRGAAPPVHAVQHATERKTGGENGQTLRILLTREHMLLLWIKWTLSQCIHLPSCISYLLAMQRKWASSQKCVAPNRHTQENTSSLFTLHRTCLMTSSMYTCTTITDVRLSESLCHLFPF